MAGKVLKVIFYTIFILLILMLVLVKPVDYLPYQQQDYYHKTIAQLNQHDVVSFTGNKDDTLRAGWSNANITPETPARLMGYGYKGNYTRVHDSVFVRTVVFSKGNKKIAFISYDFMMVHPALVEAVRKEADAIGIDYFYFTAVHTHHSYGGWATGLGGKLIAGGYDEVLVQNIASKTRQTIEKATANMAPISIGYNEYALPSLLTNRLVRNGTVDPFLRVASLRKRNGQTALICTFSAHATYTDAKLKDLSADYPGAFIRILESDADIDFALFAAGAVGSHSPAKEGSFSYDKLAHFAEQLATPVLSQAKKSYSFPDSLNHALAFAAAPLTLGEPQFKINEQWRLRPWLFHAVFGSITPQITMLQVGDILFLGFPGDFSGMLYPQLETPEGMHIVATSFNGDYVGYIIPDTYYHKKHQEAKEMNWFGPYTGSYFVEVANQLIDQFKVP